MLRLLGFRRFCLPVRLAIGWRAGGVLLRLLRVRRRLLSAGAGPYPRGGYPFLLFSVRLLTGCCCLLLSSECLFIDGLLLLVVVLGRAGWGWVGVLGWG